MILTSQEICSNSMIGKEAPILTRKEVELNSMMVSSFTHPDMMQRIVGDGVKDVCPMSREVDQPVDECLWHP